MSKADEMFNKLGYKKNEVIWKEDNKIHYIEYSNKDTYILFDIDTKTIDISSLIYIEELQAINKKCKEMGWM